MPNRTLEQLRMAHAWRCASDARGELGDQYDKYVNEVKNLSARIRTNGLGQALAYLAANGRDKNNEFKKPEGLLYRHMESWLTDRAELADSNVPKAPYAEHAGEPSNTETKVIYRIAHESSMRYRRAMSEALAYLVGLRSLAGAIKSGAPHKPTKGDKSGRDSAMPANASSNPSTEAS